MLVNGEYVVVEKIQHEILESPIHVYNFQVAGDHTYYVSSIGVLTHNSCNHNNAWASERRSHWRQRSKSVTLNGDYGNFIATTNNIKRMARGAAPIGTDGASVVLHHLEGIANDFYNYVEMTRKAHIELHKIIGYHL